MHVCALLGVSTTVTDLLRAERFYRDGFGFGRADQTMIGGPSGGPAWARLLGLPSMANAQTLSMRLGAQQIELAAFDPPGRPYPVDRAANDPWFHHIAIVVDDMEADFARVRQFAVSLISSGGPQLLPPNTGGVTAVKFRDPDGHPLELLHFPPRVGDATWHRREHLDPRGYDHSAIVVKDVGRSTALYSGLLGLREIGRSLNQGIEQDRLDGLQHCVVDVVGLAPVDVPTPHLELLCYRQSHGQIPITDVAANDIASTRLVLRVDNLVGVVDRLKEAGTIFVSPGIVSLGAGIRAATVRDPDGHMIILTD